MTALNTALAWALIHSLWIALGTWVLVNICSTFFAKASNRRLVKIGSLLLFLVVVITALFREFSSPSQISSLWYLDTESLTLYGSHSWLDQAKHWVGRYSGIISSIWIVGIVIGTIRYYYNRKALVKCENTAIHCSDSKIRHQLNRIRGALNINRKVGIRVSALVDSPMTVGFIKPVIYFPLGLISGFSSAELETILRHELAHIKRHDYLVNLFLVLIETLFFFNPIVLLLVRDLRREMEYVCDDEVLKEYDELAYTRALLKLQENSISYQVALAAQNNKSEFKNRVERMINPNKPKAGSKTAILVILFATLLISSAFVGTSPGPEPEPELVTEVPVVSFQEARQDTIKIKTKAELDEKLKELGFKYLKGKVVILDGNRVRFIEGTNKVLEKADKMMREIQQELVKDGILNENKQKITLMFQYSDVLNGKVSLGSKYEKYKGILNRYFPVYDSFATTRVFRFLPEPATSENAPIASATRYTQWKSLAKR